jgi:hypothetical protein
VVFRLGGYGGCAVHVPGSVNIYGGRVGRVQGFTGVFECLPTQNELHRHKEKLELGWTWMPPQEVATLFTELQVGL